ncbi:glycogen debranching N-terminal domain-containing protein [Egicoccus sp. AB-alg2]|uniref:amylo-alpha-1,6-glucosidase n=1 Tax=Egicoccus sp. AB-alg2 TaxID=3242693 RepID=UPI00359D145F
MHATSIVGQTLRRWSGMTDYAHVGPLGEVTCVRGEVFVVSGPDGDVRRGGDQGFFLRDTRMLDRLELRIDGERPRPLAGRAVDASRAVFHAYVAPSADHAVDPSLLVTRHRIVDGSLREEYVLENRGRQPVTVRLELRVGNDFAYIFDVKHGRTLPPVTSRAMAGHLLLEQGDGVGQTVIRGSDGVEPFDDGLCWRVHLAPGAEVRHHLDVEVTDVYGTERPRGTPGDAMGRPPTRPGPPEVHFSCSEGRMTRLVRRGLQDLASLRLRDPRAPEDRFTAAGSPWYLTLFGRDALWTAWMSLPTGLDVAAGTLRTLARRQGRRLDADTEEAPGKILHEIRRGSLAHRGDLPPNYYGTIDATPLFVVLLHEAWRWGMPEDEVADLLPNLEAALEWMRAFGDPDGDGLLEYAQQGERGLANQGWKDSHDGVQYADGRLPDPPIALVEVQAYAYDAARRGAELLDRFGRPGAASWHAYATALRRRFHETYWLEDDEGPYLAIALDGHGRPVDGPASNMGHVLASGLLDVPQAAAIARRLASPTLNNGWGLRTLATTAAGYNPVSYHAGSVWPHDTALAIWGCAVTGQRDAAVALMKGLVSAAPYFRYRLPELFAGVPRAAGDFPVPYPAACRPQAWSAAAGLLMLRACLRPRAEVPDGRLTLAPLWPPPFRRLVLRHVPIAGGWVDVSVDADRGVDHEVRGTDLRIHWDRDTADVPTF